MVDDVLRSHAFRAHAALQTDYIAFVRGTFLGEEGKEVSLSVPETTPSERMAALRTPLAKGAARYARAVQSLTDAPATVYHALRYRDLTAACATCPALFPTGLEDRLKCASEGAQRTFWQCIDELDRLAHATEHAAPPTVPSSADIAGDIARRKGARKHAPQTADGVSFEDGRADLWKALCDARGAPNADEASWSACVSRHESLDAETLLTEVPSLGTEPWTAEQLEDAQRCAAFARLSNMVPKDMMRGIERVAGKIVGSMQDDALDMSALDVDAIRELGQEALSGVSQTDIHTFVSQLGAIAPAIDKMRP